MNFAGIPIIYLCSIIALCIGVYIYVDGVSICKSGAQRQRSMRELEDGTTTIVESLSEYPELIKAGIRSKYCGAICILIGILTAFFGCTQ